MNLAQRLRQSRTDPCRRPPPCRAALRLCRRSPEPARPPAFRHAPCRVKSFVTPATIETSPSLTDASTTTADCHLLRSESANARSCARSIPSTRAARYRAPFTSFAWLRGSRRRLREPAVFSDSICRSSVFFSARFRSICSINSGSEVRNICAIRCSESVACWNCRSAAFAGYRLDPAYARRNAALRHDLEHADVARPLHVRAAAQFLAEIRNLHDAYLVAVFFAEQSHRARRDRLSSGITSVVTGCS